LDSFLKTLTQNRIKKKEDSENVRVRSQTCLKTKCTLGAA
jgi:hypothetical protein